MYRWVQRECRSLGDQDAPEVGQLLQHASQALRERPVLFKYCATEVATSRHNMLFQRCASANMVVVEWLIRPQVINALN